MLELQKARFRPDEVPDPKHKCMFASVFKTIQLNSAHQKLCCKGQSLQSISELKSPRKIKGDGDNRHVRPTGTIYTVDGKQMLHRLKCQ
jgi:hypothetical protein